MSRRHFHLCLWTRWQIRRLFVRSLTPRQTRALPRELRACASCADYYRQHLRLESALYGANEDGLSSRALERMEAVVLDAATPSATRRAVGAACAIARRVLDRPRK